MNVSNFRDIDMNSVNEILNNIVPSSPPCSICLSEHTLLAAALDDYPDPPVDLFFCINCRSVSSPFAKPYPVHSALAWHLSVADRNNKFSLDLFKDLGVDVPLVLDIGCGVGTLITAAKSLGGGGQGYDLDVQSINHGRELGLDLRAEMWNPIAEVQSINLITCISVLEHIHQPRSLLADLIKKSNELDCPLFISVPFFTQEWWHYIREPFGDGFHPFKPPRVHVSHFSHEGFEIAAKSLGARRLKPMLRRMGWSGYLINGN